MYKLLLSLFILLFLILACSDSNKNKTTIDDKSVKKNEMINGNVGKYTYSYVRKGAKIAVAFDGKGVDIENKKTSYEDAAILLTLMQTINSVSGFEDININDLKDYKNWLSGKIYIYFVGIKNE